MLLRLVQFLNAAWPMRETLSLMVTDVSPVHPSKALLLMTVILDGIINSVIPVQPEKAFSVISVILGAKVTSVRPALLLHTRVVSAVLLLKSTLVRSLPLQSSDCSAVKYWMPSSESMPLLGTSSVVIPAISALLRQPFSSISKAETADRNAGLWKLVELSLIPIISVAILVSTIFPLSSVTTHLY